MRAFSQASSTYPVIFIFSTYQFFHSGGFPFSSLIRIKLITALLRHVSTLYKGSSLFMDGFSLLSIVRSLSSTVYNTNFLTWYFPHFNLIEIYILSFWLFYLFSGLESSSRYFQHKGILFLLVVLALISHLLSQILPLSSFIAYFWSMKLIFQMSPFQHYVTIS